MLFFQTKNLGRYENYWLVAPDVQKIKSGHMNTAPHTATFSLVEFNGEGNVSMETKYSKENYKHKTRWHHTTLITNTTSTYITNDTTICMMWRCMLQDWPLIGCRCQCRCVVAVVVALVVFVVAVAASAAAVTAAAAAGRWCRDYCCAWPSCSTAPTRPHRRCSPCRDTVVISKWRSM